MIIPTGKKMMRPKQKVRDFSETAAISAFNMNAFSVVISILVASLIGPFIVRLQKRPLVWITLLAVNIIIISVYVVVRDTWHPELRGAEN